MSENPFGEFAFDGVVGLGLDALALAPEFSFFGLMSKLADLAHPSFGVFLAGDNDDFSEISFGGHNPERLRSEIKWAPVALPELGHWQVWITAVRVNNVTLDFCRDGQCRAVLDTGTSSIAVPTAIKRDLEDSLQKPLQRRPPSKEDGSVDCAKVEGALLEFDINGATISLGPGDYARPSFQASGGEKASEAEVSPAVEEEAVKVERLTECRAALLPIEMEEPLGPKLFIFGEPVLHKYYTAFDWQQQLIGFGLAAHNPDDEDEHDGEDAVGLGAKPLLVV